MKTEYYKTPKGHCYKKNKDGCKRISKEDYNKEIKKKEEGCLNKNKKVEKRTNVKTSIKYQKKKNKKGQKYYQKIDKTGKKIRISKKVYEKNALKGGVGEKREKPNTPNPNINEIEAKRAKAQKKTCLDITDFNDNFEFIKRNILEYLKENKKNFVTRLKLKDDEYRYFCHNYDDLKVSLNSDELIDQNDPITNQALPPKRIQHFHRDTNEKILKEFYACKEANQLLGPNNRIMTQKYIKIYNGDMLHLIKKPIWIDTGLPKPITIRQRIFDIINTRTKLNGYVSADVLFSKTPHLEGSEHCNQLSPELVYELKPLEPHPVQRPIKQPPPPRPVQPLNRLNINVNGWASRRTTPPQPSRQPSVLPSFLRGLSQRPARPVRILEPQSPPASRTPSPTPRTPSPPPRPTSPPPIRRYTARRTGVPERNVGPPTRVAVSGQPAHRIRSQRPPTPQSNSNATYNSNATTEEENN